MAKEKVAVTSVDAGAPREIIPALPQSNGTRFIALVDFESGETKSQYIKGLEYTVRPGNELLGRLVDVWVTEGKVALGGAAARVKGKG